MPQLKNKEVKEFCLGELKKLFSGEITSNELNLRLADLKNRIDQEQNFIPGLIESEGERKETYVDYR